MSVLLQAKHEVIEALVSSTVDVLFHDFGMETMVGRIGGQPGGVPGLYHLQGGGAFVIEVADLGDDTLVFLNGGVLGQCQSNGEPRDLKN